MEEAWQTMPAATASASPAMMTGSEGTSVSVMPQIHMAIAAITKCRRPNRLIMGPVSGGRHGYAKPDVNANSQRYVNAQPNSDAHPNRHRVGYGHAPDRCPRLRHSRSRSSTNCWSW